MAADRKLDTRVALLRLFAKNKLDEFADLGKARPPPFIAVGRKHRVESSRQPLTRADERYVVKRPTAEQAQRRRMIAFAADYGFEQRFFVDRTAEPVTHTSFFVWLADRDRVELVQAIDRLPFDDRDAILRRAVDHMRHLMRAAIRAAG